jgi:hypothetical protein
MAFRDFMFRNISKCKEQVKINLGSGSDRKSHPIRISALGTRVCAAGGDGQLFGAQNA